MMANTVTQFSCMGESALAEEWEERLPYTLYSPLLPAPSASRQRGALLRFTLDSVSALSSNKNHSLLILKDFQPTVVLTEQAGKRNIRLSQDRADSMIIQGFSPIRFAVAHLQKLFHQLIAVNVRAPVNVDAIIGIESPDQITTPDVLVIDRLWRSVSKNEVNRSGRKLLRFSRRLPGDDAHDGKSRSSQDDSE